MDKEDMRRLIHLHQRTVLPPRRLLMTLVSAQELSTNNLQVQVFNTLSRVLGI